MEDCVFCKIVKGEIPREDIYENEEFFSVPDINPVCEGHSLVISKKHFETTLDMPPILGNLLIDCIQKTAKKLMEIYKSDGFNVANNNFEAANQVVKHIHFHILPRKKGDKSPIPHLI